LQASAVPPGSDGLLFHPYLFGERSPFYNPEARGAFVGIRHWHGKGHMVRAVMEGVAFAVANCLDAVQAVAREAERPITLLRTGKSGGGQVTAWRQILADALEQTIETVNADEPGCLGAALLAGVGIGIYDDIASAIERTVRIRTRSLPDPGTAAHLRNCRAAFNDTYRALEHRLYH
jgi:xylulokinase